MRKTALVFMLCWLASCHNTQKLLTKTWKVDDVQFIDDGSAHNAQMKEAITNSLKSNITFTFMPDSTYKVVSNGEVSSSKWWLAEDKKSFYAIGPDGRTIQSKIEELKPGYFKVVFPASNGRPGYVLTCSPSK